MSWGNTKASNVHIKRIDVLRAEWDRPGFNRGLINCVGNRYNKENASTTIKNWVIEDVVTENPIPVVFKIAPYEHTPVAIDGLTLRNWNVNMKHSTKFSNEIVGSDLNGKFENILLDCFILNGERLTQKNWRQQLQGEFVNIQDPIIK